MLNATLLSNDLKMQKLCSARLAQQLLHHGLVSIVKFYPYTLKFKGKDDSEPWEEGMVVVPMGSPPTLMNRLRLYPKEHTLEAV